MRTTARRITGLWPIGMGDHLHNKASEASGIPHVLDFLEHARYCPARDTVNSFRWMGEYDEVFTFRNPGELQGSLVGA